jgi:penicillin amidase
VKETASKPNNIMKNAGESRIGGTPRAIPRALRIAAVTVLLGLVLLVLAAVGARTLVRASLPPLDGVRAAPLLSQEASIERDAQGVATITAGSSADLAYASGFAHAQDRFLQMDLLRRVASGELAALIGPGALELDRSHRLHRFRARAHQIAASLDAHSRTLLESYAAGVNAGLASLRSRPFEYWALRAQPQSWSPEDTLLVVYAMYFDLQYGELRRTLARAALRERVSPDLLTFLLPTSSHWDAPLDALPPAGASRTDIGGPTPPPEPDWLRAAPLTAAALDSNAPGIGTSMIGSNSWVIGPTATVNGRAIVANDMHLGLSLPNIWYRVTLRAPDRTGVLRQLTGVSLPGTPGIVAGSNGRIAWGFTNSYGNFIDLIELDIDPHDPLRYRTPRGDWERAQVHRERIDVHGAPAVELDVADTRWGPILRAEGHSYAIRWVAHDARAVNLGLGQLADSDDVPAALAAAAACGIPTQNIVVADAAGHIGWTLAGPLPQRAAAPSLPDLPVDANTYRGWDGYLNPRDYPHRIDPPGARLWTANSRQLSGAAQLPIGDGGSDVGARATQIRDALFAREHFAERDLLGLQTDDRAPWIAQWRRMALDALDENALAGHPRRAEYWRLLEQWNGRADADAVGYTLVRAFYAATYDAWFGQLDDTLAKVDANFGYRVATSRSLAVMEALAQHHAWVPQGVAGWHAFMLDRVDRAIESITRDGTRLAEARWGERNRATIAHPFARMIPTWLPVLRNLLMAPRDPLPGDANVPRVQSPSFGASERFVISPGHERDALFEMPGGQSGNPMSPYFLAGHVTWVRGEAAALLPGASQHRLVLMSAPVR